MKMNYTSFILLSEYLYLAYGIAPRKPRFDKVISYRRTSHMGVDGIQSRMLNILHMSSNMCVFAYIVYYINTFIYILILHTGLHTGLHPVNPALIKSYFL